MLWTGQIAGSGMSWAVTGQLHAKPRLGAFSMGLHAVGQWVAYSWVPRDVYESPPISW